MPLLGIDNFYKMLCTVYSKTVKSSNFWKRAVAWTQCTLHSCSEARLIRGKVHALRTHANRKLKRTQVYVKLLRKMMSGLDNRGIFSFNLLE